MYQDISIKVVEITTRRSSFFGVAFKNIMSGHKIQNPIDEMIGLDVILTAYMLYIRMLETVAGISSPTMPLNHLTTIGISQMIIFNSVQDFICQLLLPK